MNTRQQFLEVSYEGKKLLEQHSLSDTGIWQVKGEDPNCDFGGSHHQPTLGYFEGTLEEIIDLAVTLPHFWNWGAGGSITKISVQTPSDVRQQTRLLKQKQSLIDQLASVEALLKRIQK